MSKLPVEMRALAEAATRASSPRLPSPPSSAKPRRPVPDRVPHPLPPGNRQFQRGTSEPTGL
jgi:hypothetical protein